MAGGSSPAHSPPGAQDGRGDKAKARTQWTLTALQLQRAGLGVQGEVTEVHVAHGGDRVVIKCQKEEIFDQMHRI